MSIDQPMPHDKLLAYQVALQLLREVRDLEVTDQRTRDQLLRASKSVCLNISEAVGRFTNADRKRVYAIARGECCEAAAALDVARAARECDPEKARVARNTAGRAYGLLTGLIRHYDFETGGSTIGHRHGDEHLHGDLLENENEDGDVLDNGDGHGDGS
jgi:four helix bundle protein